MKRYPTATMLERIGGIDRATALHVRRILDGRADPRTVPAVKQWIDQCFNEPRGVELKLAAVDALLRTCGTESIHAEDAWNHYWCDSVAVYCNNGDAYEPTVLYDVERDRFVVTSWADWVETAERNRRYCFR